MHYLTHGLLIFTLGIGIAHAEVTLSEADKKQIAFLYAVPPVGTEPDAGKVLEWGETGHQYTTFIVARLANWDVASAVELCWGSQAPDEITWFTAVWAAVPTIFGSNYHRSLMTTLHSLHGGNKAAVAKRQKDLQSLITRLAATGSFPKWQVGLMIHAFGDSFAHVDETGSAFGYPLGHAVAGHKPDTISQHMDAYLAYVKTLFATLAGKEAAAELAPLFEVVKTLPANERRAVAEMAKYAESLGLTREVHAASRKKWVKGISRSDIEVAMAVMEAHFKSATID